MTRAWPRSTRARFQASAVLAAAFVVALALSSSGPSSASASSSVDQAALQACIAQRTVNCEQTVPGLSKCMAQRAICNEPANADLRAQAGPLQPFGTGTAFLTRARGFQAVLLLN